MPRRVWTTADTFEAQVEIANYGPQTIDSATDWSLTDEQGREVARGSLPSKRLETGRTTVTGMIHTALANVYAPARLIIRVGLTQERTVENTWNSWIYPMQGPLLSSAALSVRSPTRSMRTRGQRWPQAGVCCFSPHPRKGKTP